MCGITAIIGPYPDDHERLTEMTHLLEHRGPDGFGFHQSPGASLGHRRLAILDLSPAGAQPMPSEDGRIHLVCNGEIYNYQDLTVALKEKGHIFNSDSDSEVLVHLYEEEGEGLFERVNGMFALAIWDENRRLLVAAVDRFGKKPLYYAFQNDRLVMASELKSLLLFPWVKREINHRAVDRYLHFRYIPAPDTIYRHIYKLEPAQLLLWSADGLKIRRYWRPERRGPLPFNRQAVEAFTGLLNDAVRIRLSSDVPLGIYLSGGVDSATVAGVMRPLVNGPKISYTASFEYEYNEYERAGKLASYLGYDFNPVSIAENDFHLLPRIAFHLDEPLGDLIVLPQYILARQAKKQLTVVLTGDGADETLGGYFHQKVMTKWLSISGGLKRPGVSSLLGKMVSLIPPSLLDLAFDYPDRLGPRERSKLVEALTSSRRFGTFYQAFTACFTVRDKDRLFTPEFKKLAAGEPLADEFDRELSAPEGFSFLARLSLMDLKYWLPFILIYRLDKLNMAHAIENRSPYLDYRLVEMALNLDDSAKLNSKRSKEILRQVNEKIYPPDLRVKGKQAFYMPFLAKHREGFRTWAGKLINRETVIQRGYFHWPPISDLYLASARGSMLANRQLVALAMLEEWHRQYQP
ncbi:MAG: asparagine synthase (glutamine-hydrolyzing) [Thermodesulfobacteriota bacterium]